MGAPSVTAQWTLSAERPTARSFRRSACRGTGIPVGMEWHRGNIGSMLQGLSVVVIAIAALVRSPAALRALRAQRRSTVLQR
jgi:hypothetical protein